MVVEPLDTEPGPRGLFQGLSHHQKFLTKPHDIKHCISSITSYGPAQFLSSPTKCLGPLLLVWDTPELDGEGIPKHDHCHNTHLEMIPTTIQCPRPGRSNRHLGHDLFRYNAFCPHARKLMLKRNYMMRRREKGN